MGTARSYYLDLVTGRHRGPIGSVLLLVLAIPAACYRAAIVIRNGYYGLVRSAARRASCPVISIGNITVGGTGKTPMAAKIAQSLIDRGRKAAILSRGYKGSAIPFDENRREQAAAQWSAASDEAAVLKRRCPRIPVYLGPDRVASAAKAVEQGADVLVLDDGFQHRRLARDLDIVLVDATAPFGQGRMLPRGLLREPLSSLHRAGLIVLTRSDEVDPSTKTDILRTIARASNNRAVAQAVHRVEGFVDIKGRPMDSVDPASMQAVIFAGIGNFESFRRCVQRLGVRVLAAYEYPDHHYYTVAEIDGLQDTAAMLEANVLLTTEKDAVKLVGRWDDQRCPLLALNLKIEFDEPGYRILSQALDAALARRPMNG
jgi:tetraacyldisaccharide 4'-kinase